MIKLDKDYKVYDVKKGKSKNDKPYTVLKIADAYKDPNDDTKWLRNYYSVFIMDDIQVATENKIKILKFQGFKYSSRDYNGKTYVDATIYVNADDIFNENGVSTNNANPDWGNEELPF